MGKCPDCGGRTYADDGDSCDCTKCCKCGTVGDEDFCVLVNGDQYCEECLDELTGEQLGVTEEGKEVYEYCVMASDRSGYTDLEDEYLTVPEGAIGYNPGCGWVFPCGWKPAPEAT